MSDLISKLQSQTGLDADAASRGLGALLNFLKEKLPPELFARVEGAVPQVQEAISSFLSSEQSSGVLSKVGDLVGGLLGDKGGALPQLLAMLSKSGLSLDQAKAFVPAAIEALKERLPDGLLEEMMEKIPGLGDAIGGAES